MNTIKLSVITVVYNENLWIENTILSVIKQKHTSFEYIIIDGKSTDGTLEIIQQYTSRIDKLISETDKGIYDAMNKGLSIAKGEYVLFINAGDQLYDPHVLSGIFESHSDFDVLVGETMIIDQEGNELGTRSDLTTRKLPQHLTVNSFLAGQVVSHQSFIAKRSLCPEYDLQYSCSADIDWMIRICKRADTIGNCGRIISKYLRGGKSDLHLKRCWKERWDIMVNHFHFGQVFLAHIKFAIRYLRFGAYRNP